MYARHISHLDHAKRNRSSGLDNIVNYSTLESNLTTRLRATPRLATRLVLPDANLRTLKLPVKNEPTPIQIADPIDPLRDLGFTER